MSGPPGSQVLVEKKGKAPPAASAPSKASPIVLPVPPLEESFTKDGQLKLLYRYPKGPGSKAEQGSSASGNGKLADSLRSFRLRGVTNPSNCCYLASTMQAIIHYPPLAHLLSLVAALYQDDPEVKSLAPTSLLMGQWVTTYWKGAASPVPTLLPAPRFPSVIFQGGNTATGQLQEDAHEFFSKLMSIVDSELLQLTALSPAVPNEGLTTSTGKGKKKMAKGEEQETNEEGGGGKWTLVGRGKEKLNVKDRSQRLLESADGVAGVGNGDSTTSLLHQHIFGGTLHSFYSGGQGVRKGTTDVVVEPFLILPLAIASVARQTVEEALLALCSKEVIEAAKEGGKDMKKVTSLGNLPGLLILQLQRYCWTSEGVIKIDNVVDFGLELVIPDGCRSPVTVTEQQAKSGGSKGSKRRYQLIAVICHRGTTPNTGHYVTAIPRPSAPGQALQQRSGKDDSVQAFDVVSDAKCSTATLTQVINDSPYMLFYQLCKN